MFDYCAGSLFEVADELPCRFCVDVVVERHFLAGKYLGVGDPRTRGLIESGLLMRILAVSQIRDLLHGPGQALTRQG